MKVTELRQRADVVGIMPGKMMKDRLIRAIRSAEGYMPCYGRSKGDRVYTGCCFQEGGLKVRIGVCRILRSCLIGRNMLLTDRHYCPMGRI